ncbi:MAG: hypothetical protein JJU34_16630 [Lunatimonas sp.]|uniref:hypothetical protein n=1 Tax=Lunatimonas sp. TaxID=2060141 RepID=UPI00263A7E92|nr:hypothetical protein [Lunatimonas sp.]MCC5938905.1 hypothetical protein [Lunatimonas sp.]
MTNKLSSILTHYRQYQADQVLTHTQLNESIAYFEDQDRLTRIGLIGVGIVNGLKVTVAEDAGVRQIQVGQGYGITTDGDLLTLKTNIPGSPRNQTSIDIDQLTFTHYRSFEDDKAEYPLFHEEGTQVVSLWELCDGDADGALPLSGLTNLAQWVLVLYLESYSRDQDICGDINCDNQGLEQVAILRCLLVEADAMDALVASDTIFQRFDQLRNAVSGLSYIHPLKVVLNETNAQTPVQLDRLYRDAIVQGNSIEEFTDGLSTILTHVQFLWEGDIALASFSEELETLLSQHFNFPANVPYQYNQYRYRLLSDLLDVYRRLLSEVATFSGLENPSIRAFPKHLLLGTLVGTGYRHDFYPSPANSEYQQRKQRILSYLRKLYFMMRAFGVQEATEVRLIPSGDQPASGVVGSIPFYYRDQPGLLENWSIQPKVTPISYRYNLGENPLLNESEYSNFYYLGGHLRGNGENVFQTITNIQRQFGLDFSLFHFDYQQYERLRSFVQTHRSCRHMAGVPRSGTLILLSNNNEVIGDLALDYRVSVVEETQAVSHIKVAESRYPWISTLSYLNNLARSLRGTPRRVGVMPRVYRLVVREYTINGVSQVAGSTEVLVPLEQILMRRMHAITEALNQRFPNGLVFDFNEELKRFVIIRAYDDQFRVTFADTTLSLNAPAFTYTEDGMFRSDRLFRLNAIRSEERRRYRDSTYRQLQSEFAPINKDDDYGKYQGKWAEWYRLIDQLSRTGNSLVNPRFITRQNQLPLSVRNIIMGVFNRLNATGRPFELYLTGDWLDGSWVSIEMINRYGGSSNTNDPIVRFLRLRQNLHHKTQATKASLFLVLGRESDRRFFENLITTLGEAVDIYLDGPRVGRRNLIIDGMERIRISATGGTIAGPSNIVSR